MHFADQMIQICKTRNTRLVVGLDPHWKMIPQNFKDRNKSGHGETIAALGPTKFPSNSSPL